MTGYQKFSTRVISKQSALTTVDFSTEQSIIIDNNINLNITINFNTGILRDSTLKVEAIKVDNNFALNLSTGETNLGSRVIQSADAQSDTKSTQKGTVNSQVGYNISTQQTTESKIKMFLGTSFGPNWPIIVGFIGVAIIAIFVAYYFWCKGQVFCPSSFCWYPAVSGIETTRQEICENRFSECAKKYYEEHSKTPYYKRYMKDLETRFTKQYPKGPAFELANSYIENFYERNPKYHFTSK